MKQRQFPDYLTAQPVTVDLGSRLTRIKRSAQLHAYALVQLTLEIRDHTIGEDPDEIGSTTLIRNGIDPWFHGRSAARIGHIAVFATPKRFYGMLVIVEMCTGAAALGPCYRIDPTMMLSSDPKASW